MDLEVVGFGGLVGVLDGVVGEYRFVVGSEIVEGEIGCDCCRFL